MRKVPTLFVRDAENPAIVTRQVNPDAAWVLDDRGVATRKWNGTCVMWDGDEWWARRVVKPGKLAPAGFAELESDPNTGKRVGWEPAGQSGFVRWLAEALTDSSVRPAMRPGTFELVGPKVNQNPEHLDRHELKRHGVDVYPSCPRGFDDLVAFLTSEDIEGIVWHHPDGRMAKVKGIDFGIRRER